jgi:hypothetical protein
MHTFETLHAQSVNDERIARAAARRAAREATAPRRRAHVSLRIRRARRVTAPSV